jgi:transcriptional regulator with XRE-family HTH domain
VSANDQLRAARERTASPNHPGEGVSRQELAELVNAYIWENHRKRVELDANYIGKLERGDIRWPSQLYREALRSVLNVSTDAALGLVNPRRPVVQRPLDLDRAQFLRGAAVLGASAMSLSPDRRAPRGQRTHARAAQGQRPGRRADPHRRAGLRDLGSHLRWRSRPRGRAGAAALVRGAA